MFFCAKIGSECPHGVFADPNYVFVLMPFKNSASIFDCIKRAVEGMKKKKFTCERSDKQYTSFDIWCKKICRSIRRAKYLIVDTSGTNANVFYELGFAHALGHTKNIIITKNIKEVPFDVRGFSIIQYTEKNFPKLEQDLQKALSDLEAEETYDIDIEQSSEEMIKELKANLQEEEKRSDGFKRGLLESEKREEELKKRIAELEAIEKNPAEAAQKLIAEKEGEIVRLRKELGFIDQKKKEEVRLLQQQMEGELQLRQELEKELEKFNKTGDAEKLSLVASRTKKEDWQTQLFKQGMKLQNEEKFKEAVTVFTQLIDKNPNHKRAYLNRAFCLHYLNDFESVIADLTKSIELNPKDSIAFTNRGLAYRMLNNFNSAIADYTKALELDPKDATIFVKRGLAYRMLNNFNSAIADYTKALELDPKDATIFVNRGLAYSMLNNFNSAIADYNKALELDPKAIDARQNLTEVLIFEGKTVEAEQSALVAIDLNRATEELAISYYLLALSLKLQGKDTEKVDAELERLCSKKFKITYGFDEIENWLRKENIPEESKDYIRKKTKMLKKHILAKPKIKKTRG